jgi:hypothetical protein
MFNGQETVEEVATGRIGVIVASGIVGQPLEKWTVQFRDGRPPIMKDFMDASKLRLIEPANDAEMPRLIPRNPVT